ncbi:MAG: ATP-binding protein [Candidatus Krumholzibacteriia bacterium]
MRREIIAIDEALCDGCGKCAIGCAEGAIRIVDGKAKLVKADFCDGFGHCIGTCHTGALTIVTREAPGFAQRELRQWPVQLRLVRPGAPFFKDRELVIMSTCGPLASAETHQRHLRGRSVVVACPKLDDTSGYAQKLGAILADRSIPKAIVVIMEVPCCGGLSQLVRQALAASGRTDLVIEEHVLALTGELKVVRGLSA